MPWGEIVGSMAVCAGSAACVVTVYELTVARRVARAERRRQAEWDRQVEQSRRRRHRAA